MTTSLKDRLVAPLLHALRSGASMPTLKEKHANLFELADAALAPLRQTAIQPDAPVPDHAPGCPPESQLLH
ncbi:MAG: hypothetical protein EPN61_14885 [Burkholderiaceae bacterium]|nr:MAG: hypothetical protein EPN61_14885 [Burkholderiaceae bacterium]